MNRFTDSLQIIIVIYRRRLKDSESFQSVRSMFPTDQKLNLFVYDNSPSSQEVGEHDGLRITYFHDPKNSGVSKAYNTGAAHAKENGKEWMLLLDQDTRLPNSILEKYHQAKEANTKINLFVPVLKLKSGKIFSPSRYRFKRGFYVNQIESGTHSLYNLAPVNSGIMVKTEAFFKVGGYNDKVKLDFADFQFVERFRKFYPDFFVIDAAAEQDFSDDESSYKSQSVRFKYFCEGARNMEGKNFWDWIQCHSIVSARMMRLTLRYGKFGFINSYFKYFLHGSEV